MSRAQLLAVTFLWGLLTSTASAEPTAPALFCAANPTIPVCSGRTVDCSFCHTATAPAAWNDYGLAVKRALDGEDFDTGLAAAIRAVARADSDGDGVSNGDELLDGTAPGNAASVLRECPGVVPAAARTYDFARAFRRLHVLYCGRSPSFEEVTAFDALAGDAAARYAAIDAALDACLDSAYWREEGVQRLADTRIRPLQPAGSQGAPQVNIGEYAWDYRLWTYIMTDDRDMRDLLLADYHVENLGGKLVKRTGIIAGPRQEPSELTGPVMELLLLFRGSPQGQPLEPERRAGMITTSWFFAINTMFSVVPRTAAAQAYRAYLGQDLALLEGIHPVPNEPADIDGRGIAAPGCRECHSTVDPMSYAFIWYEGVKGADTGSYNPKRPQRAPGWANNQGMLLGQPIKDARDFAKVAVASDLFPRNLAMILLRHAIERSPSEIEEPEFEALWRSIPEDGWSANRLIHRIVASSFFGGGT